MERLMKMLGKSKRAKAGFTLIELMIVVIIVGILAAAAVPIYTGFVKRAYITEAKAAIGTIRSAEDVYFAEYGEYLPSGDGTWTLATGDLAKLAIDLSHNSWWTLTNADFKITVSGDSLTTLIADATGSPESKIEDIVVTFTIPGGIWVVTP